MFALLFTIVSSLLIVQFTRTCASSSSFAKVYWSKDPLKRHFIKKRFVDNFLLLIMLVLVLSVLITTI